VRLAIGAGSLGLILGLGIGWQLWGAAPPIVEAPAPEVIQADGSRIFERAPDPTARPAAQVPRGATLERVVRVEVQPEPAPRVAADVPRGTPADSLPPCACAPVALELSLVRLPDGSRRVIASATSGTILSGVDIPVESAAPRRVLKWSAGAEYDLASLAWGGYLERDLERALILPLPLRIGASLTPGTAASGPRVGFRIGLRF